LFDATVRANPAQQDGIEVERVAGVVRLTGLFNYISFWRLTAESARSAVQAQAEHFRTRGEMLMWRVYDYDGPSALSACLAEEGFAPDDPGTLMVFDLADALRGAPASDADIRRVQTVVELDDFVAAAGEAFGEEETWRRKAYESRLDDPDLALFVAYESGRAVGSARLEMSPACPFGHLFGGGVAPAHRRRGRYRAMVAARVDEARQRGLKYLSTEARDTSRPILQSLGFIPVARATKWVLRPG